MPVKSNYKPAPAPQDIPATGISITPATMTLSRGKTITLTAVLVPPNSTDTVTWTTSNAAFATINPAAGMITDVTGVAPGSTAITATASSGASAQRAIRVML